MRIGKIVMVTGLVVIGEGIWFGRGIWAGHYGLVTLHVRNTPLAEVARAIEGQVHQKIRVDQKLDAKVTIDVNNMPLTNVLDLLAEQSGARWGKTYAVYDSASALGRLEDVFTGSSTLDAAGWTNVAPRVEKVELPPMSISGGGLGPRRIVMNAPDGLASGAGVANTEDVSVGPDSGGRVVVRGNGPGGDDGQPGKRVMMRMSRGPGGVTTTKTTMDETGEHVSVTKSSPEGLVLQQDDWSQERLVMETPLAERLGDAVPEKATRETAEQTAAKVHGKYAFYYGLEKPPIGGDFGMHPEMKHFAGNGGTNDPRAMMEAAKNMPGGLGKLSPEQQVQRARQMQDANGPSK